MALWALEVGDAVYVDSFTFAVVSNLVVAVFFSMVLLAKARAQRAYKKIQNIHTVSVWSPKEIKA